MKQFGLALSGGGYRAAAFHLGTLRALAKLNLLDKVDKMSTISGGSITGSAWALSIGKVSFHEFEQSMVETLATKSVIGFVFKSRSFMQLILFALLFLVPAVLLLFSKSYAWLSFPVLAIFIYLLFRLQFKLFPVSKEIERAYDKFFFHSKTLSALPDKPFLGIGSTNLLSTTPFTFSKNAMWGANYDQADPPIKFNPTSFPLSRAVVASSCVPFAFTPVTIGREYYAVTDDFDRTDSKLVDGGVFDNQGVHKLTDRSSRMYCPIVLVSDAGNLLPFRQSFNNTIILLIRTVDVFMDRIKGFQMAQNIFNRNADANAEVAYVSLGWDVNEAVSRFYQNMVKQQLPLPLLKQHGLPEQWISHPADFQTEILNYMKMRIGLSGVPVGGFSKTKVDLARSVGTNLTRLSLDEILALAEFAEIMTAVQLTLYCPTLFSHDNDN